MFLSILIIACVNSCMTSVSYRCRLKFLCVHDRNGIVVEEYPNSAAAMIHRRVTSWVTKDVSSVPIMSKDSCHCMSFTFRACSSVLYLFFTKAQNHQFLGFSLAINSQATVSASRHDVFPFFFLLSARLWMMCYLQVQTVLITVMPPLFHIHPSGSPGKDLTQTWWLLSA